jgi:cell wall-associated NlpC family hydrolase
MDTLCRVIRRKDSALTRVARTLAAIILAGALTIGILQQAKAQQPRYVTGWNIAQTAVAHLGAPYAWIGDSPQTGYSCVGLVHHVFALWGVYAPENLWALWNGYTHIAPQYIRPGDVVLFANTVWPGLSHAAIYISGGWVVGADNFAWGVHRDYLYDPYWYSRWIGTVRVVW